MATRRSTRRTAASAEPAPPELAQDSQDVSAAAELPRKRTRKGKAAAAAIDAALVEPEPQSQSRSQPHSQSHSQSQPTKASATSRAASASTKTTTTTAATAVTKRTTRAAKAAGDGSPLRVLQSPERKRKTFRGRTTSATPEPPQPEPAHDHDSDDNDQGIFFSKSFDAQLRNLPTTSPLRPMFISGSESAYALLTKLETAAKEPLQGKEAATKDAASSRSDLEVNMDCPPQPLPTKRTYEESTTPARPIVPSSFFTRSFSALKSIKSLFSTPTPKAPSPPKASSPPKAAPPPNSLTETLSTPPTPVGERAKTPAKKNKVDRLMRTLLKGIDPSDERKAAEWARQIIPSLKNDDAFREKRKRLEKRVLLKDLNNLPSAKPWETGFGDPLADMDDDDVVPVWAVYLDMIAEEEERVAKKHKKTHDEAAMDFEDVPTINEQYAASQSARSSRRRFDGHGRSASDLGSYPRRSIVPSPMFDTSLSHHRGENVFNELQGHDTAAKIRTNDREALQAATKASPQPHDSGTGSFSVPDDSDEDDSSIIGETDGNVSSPAASVWTQAPPPAPVPAHAPLPGGAAADTSPATATERPVDEIERQRQRLMKHTPAKPSRLREATYPSPSLFSDAGNDSILMATPEQTAAAMNTIFNSMPGAEMIQLEPEEQAALDAIVGSDAYKQELATPWDPPIVSYDSDEEDLSPV